jgi:glycosyltransferase involved in cell wall biosynthesis
MLNETPGFHNGGANRVVVETCHLLQAAGHAVAVAFHHATRNDLRVPAFALGTEETPGALTRRLATIVGEFRPDLVEVHGTEGWPALGWLETRVPTCVFFHDHSWHCAGGDRMTRGYTPCHRAHGTACLAWQHVLGCGGKSPFGNWTRWRRVQSLAGLRTLAGIDILVASHHMRTAVLENGCAPERVQVVPLFADPPGTGADEPPIEPGLLLLPSRLVAAKGVQVALAAVAQLRHRPWRLVIAGEGHYRGELESLTRRLSLQDRVQFLGDVAPTALANWYSRSQMVLFPVLRPEPFGLIGVEAMAHGRPIVAFAGGAVDEWLLDGETGLRIDGHTAEALAGGIERLLADPALAARFGAAARRRHAALFTPAAYRDRLLAAFRHTQDRFRTRAV